MIDNVSDVFDGLGFFSRPQSEANLATERASANFDARHRFSSSYVWTLPGLDRHPVLGGWILSGFFVARSGQPFTVNSSFDVNQDGVLTDRLNRTAGIRMEEHGPVRLVLPPDAVQDRVALDFIASPGANGIVGRNTFRARGLLSLDFALLKRFALNDQSKIEFRVELFNAFNRTHFGVPVRILESPGFGRSVDTSVGARQIQFALKLMF